MSSAVDEVFRQVEPGPVPPAHGAPRPVAAVVRQAFTRPPIPFAWSRDFREADASLPEIVEGLLTAGGMSVWFGESNSGKTYLALHLCMCIARGVAFLGRRVLQGAVIYIACEGDRSVRRRVAAHEKHFDVKVDAFGLVSATLSLMDPSADVEDFIELYKVQATAMGLPIQLVVIDTVARAMAGANENASEDMARFVSAADRIRQETGAHVLCIHHSGKDSARGARGHSSLRAAVDTEVEVTADEGTHTHTAYVTKQRDLSSKGLRLAGRFVSVELGQDQWGNAATACAVEDADPSQASAPRSKVSGPAQQAVMGFLAGQAAGVRKAQVVEALAPQGVARPSVYRAINALLELGLITESMGLVYRPKE